MPTETKLSRAQCVDAGLALVLICLLCALFVSPGPFLPLGTGLLVICMAFPGLFRPFAKIWFAISHYLGVGVSRILLTGLFFLLVTPVGLIRRLLGKDTLLLKQWKQGRDSVFHDRDRQFSGRDLELPY